MIFYLMLLALVPPALVLLLMFFSDRFEKEPLHRIFFCIAGGVLTTVFITLTGKLFPGFYRIELADPSLQAALNSFIHAGLIEETLKFIIVYLLVIRSRHFNEPFDAVVYYVAVAAGFALIENLQYIYIGSHQTMVNAGMTGLYEPFLEMSALMAVVRSMPAHMVFAGLSGYFVSRYKFHKPLHAKRWLWLAWGIGIFVHGTFNFLLTVMPIGVKTVAAASWLFLAAGVGVLLNVPLILKSPFNRPRRLWSRQLRKEYEESRTYSRHNLLCFAVFTVLVIGLVVGTFYLNVWIVTGSFGRF